MNPNEEPYQGEISDTLKHMAKEIHRTACEKGWWDSDRNNGEMIALMHSELTEMIDAYEAGEMDDHLPDTLGYKAEAADVVIRVLDTCYNRGWDCWSKALDVIKSDGWSPDRSVSEGHRMLSQALEALRHKKDPSKHFTSVITYMAMAVGSSYALIQVMRKKMDYNKNRERMHGGKQF